MGPARPSARGLHFGAARGAGRGTDDHSLVAARDLDRRLRGRGRGMPPRSPPRGPQGRESGGQDLRAGDQPLGQPGSRQPGRSRAPHHPEPIRSSRWERADPGGDRQAPQPQPRARTTARARGEEQAPSQSDPPPGPRAVLPGLRRIKSRRLPPPPRGRGPPPPLPPPPPPQPPPPP